MFLWTILNLQIHKNFTSLKQFLFCRLSSKHCLLNSLLAIFYIFFLTVEDYMFLILISSIELFILLLLPSSAFSEIFYQNELLKSCR